MSVYHRSQGHLTTWMCLGIGFLVKLKKNPRFFFDHFPESQMCQYGDCGLGR